MPYYLAATCTEDETILEVEDTSYRSDTLADAHASLASQKRLGPNLWSDGAGGFITLVEYND